MHIVGRRNVIVLSLSGVFRKHGISKDSTIALIDTLARHDGISQETDVRKAISVVEETFKKDIKSHLLKNTLISCRLL